MAASNTLNKTQRLKSRKAIDAIFKKSKSLTVFPFRILYLIEPASDCELKAGFSAPSRNFKEAVDRNRIKRLTKEAYRLNRHELQEAVSTLKIRLNVFMIYTGKELPDHQLVTDKIIVSLQQLTKKLYESFPSNT